MPSINAILGTLMGGFVLGSIYSMMALGLNLIWGTTNIFNFAHGVLAAIGAYIGWTLLTAYPVFGVNYWIVIPLTCILTFLIGLLLYFSSVLPVIHRRSFAMDCILTTLGFSIFSEYILLYIFGPRYKQSPTILRGTLDLGPLSTRHDYLVICAISLITFFLVWLFLHKTRAGLAIRAVEQDRMAAQLMGINLTRIRILIFGLAAALAGGISGLLLSSMIAIQPSFGDNILLPSYMIVVVGGLGSVKGTIMGAFLIAVVTQFISLFLDIFWANAVVYLFILALLTLRPMGLAGVTTG